MSNPLFFTFIKEFGSSNFSKKNEKKNENLEISKSDFSSQKCPNMILEHVYERYESILSIFFGYLNFGHIYHRLFPNANSLKKSLFQFLEVFFLKNPKKWNIIDFALGISPHRNVLKWFWTHQNIRKHHIYPSHIILTLKNRFPS